jgi:hypothetical protein
LREREEEEADWTFKPHLQPTSKQFQEHRSVGEVVNDLYHKGVENHQKKMDKLLQELQAQPKELPPCSAV